MARKRRVKVVEKIHVVNKRKGMDKDKAEGIMAIMSAVLVLLSAMLNPMVSVIISLILLVLFASYKLFKR